MNNERKEVGPVNAEAPIDGEEAKLYGPIPLFAKDAATQIEKIKQDHGFNPNFDLLTRLRHIRYELREWFGYSAIATKQKRLFAKKINEHAQALIALIALLQSAHDDELAFLAGEMASRPYEKGPVAKSLAPQASARTLAEIVRISGRLARLGPDLKWLADRAVAASDLKAPRGRPHDHLLKHLLRGIRVIYLDQFGKKARRITRADKFSGKFFDFVVAVLPLFGEEIPPNNTLGVLLKDACDTIDEDQEQKTNLKN